MAENDQTKVCPLCAETIKAAAKICPYCRKYQGWFFFINVFDASALVTVAFFVGMVVLIFNVFSQGRNFSSSRGKIVVLNSQLAMGVSRYSTNVVVTGVLTNLSDYAWQDLRFEVRYFDDTGKIIDADHVGSISYLDHFTVLSHSNHSFSLDLWKRESIPKYASYLVLVSSASDPRNWLPEYDDESM